MLSDSLVIIYCSLIKKKKKVMNWPSLSCRSNVGRILDDIYELKI